MYAMLTAIRTKLYDLLVNRSPGICQRYHKAHDYKSGVRKLLSWGYLLWLNFACHVLQLRFLGRAKEMELYEKKRLPVGKAESEETYRKAESFVEELTEYDVISFDVFDTLLLRPFSRPEDLFYQMEDAFSCMDFRRIRMEAEHQARAEAYKKKGSYEVALADIWKRVEALCGIPSEKGMSAEMRCEQKFCRANPLMQNIYRMLKEQGKTVVFTTDMYLPKTFIRGLLSTNGFEETDRIFLSSDWGTSKAEGGLYECVKRTMGVHLRYAHVGDNRQSDVKMARKHGFKAFWYPNVNQYTQKYRCCDMSPIIGSAYRGIINSRVHCGDRIYSPTYEYGYIYGGLFVTGYCHFIHRYCQKNGIDKILFLSRDGEILKKAYDLLYPRENTEYVYWSRFAAAKMTAGYMKYDYLRKLVFHKINRGISLEQILSGMELQELTSCLRDAGLDASESLTGQNLESFLVFLNNHWKEILHIYLPQRKAAGEFLSEKLQGCRQAAAVDIGWAGSGALALDQLVRKEWNIPCRIIGIVAGTNTASNAEPDMSEGFLLSGRIVSYLYHSGYNRDLWKKHNPAKNYNLYWELLASSVEPSLQGYYWNEKEKKPELRFSVPEGNPEGIREIQKGILDFVKDYDHMFHDEESMKQISGRDAYGPMLLAASHEERYLKSIAAAFHLKIDVGA